MAAGTWAVYASAKQRIGNGTIVLGTTAMKMSLHTSAASTPIAVLSTRSVWSSIGSEIAATGGYAAGGRALVPSGGSWVVGASAKQYKFTMSTVGVLFTASGASLTNVRYAVIRASAGSTTSGYVLCYAALSTAQFTITSPNILNVTPAATGIFTLA